MSDLRIEADSPYDTTARTIAERLGLRVWVKLAASQTAPRWGKNGVHGHKYRVSLLFPRRGADREIPKRGPLSFDFWGSHHDAMKGDHPTTYDILACVSSDMSGLTDPDQVAEEYGPMPPSHAIAAAKFAERLQAFFTEAERAALAEIPDVP